jgi:hypothetical protein
MVIRLFAVGLCAAAIAAMTLAPADAVAQTGKRHYSYAGKRDTSRPRARVVVAPRSFLDAGTEVKPGDRKFTDYAFPPGFQGSSGYVTNTGGKVGWDRSPFMQPFQLPGFGPW